MSEDWRATTPFGTTPPPPVPPPGGSTVTAPPTVTATPTVTAPTTTAAPQPRLYFPPPPFIPTIRQYQDVNRDENLQYSVTIYFLDRVIDNIKYNQSWKKYKKFKKYLKGSDGYNIMHKLLRLFVKRGNTNWFDLKSQRELVEDYIKYKLKNI